MFGYLLRPLRVRLGRFRWRSWIRYFDEWRERYDALTFHDVQRAYKQISRVFPDQRHFHSEPLKRFLSDFPSRLSVCELGGWDGGLASEIFEAGANVAYWRNYDVADIPSVCDDPRYSVWLLHDWFWNQELPDVFDLFVSTHTIEHLSTRQFELVIQKLSSLPRLKAIYLEAPLRENGQNWKGELCNHILTIGWGRVREMMRSYGWLPTMTSKNVLIAKRGRFSLA